MGTDDERRRVAAALRAYDGKGVDADTIGEVTAIIIGAGDADGWSWREIYARLADLIEPDTTSDTTKSAEDTTKTPTSSDTAPTSSDASATHTDATATCDTSQGRRDTVACDPTGRGVDSIYEWCRGRLEGADGAEDYLYCTIMRAIEDYRHPERATAHTVRAVDREALLEEVKELEKCAWYFGLDFDADEPLRDRLKEASEDFAGCARRIREALGVVA